ncbi:reverse transcriptase domain-containing protein [Tanacetum coccineum]
MITYLKNMGRITYNQLKNKSGKKATSSKKRPRAEPDEESVKSQKIREALGSDWEVYFEDTRRYWRIIRVGNHTEAYQIFADMLKKFNRDDMVNKPLILVRRRVTLENLFPMDDEPMWAADHVVAPTPGSAITIPETANEFAIKGNHLTLVKGNQFDGRTKTDPHKHIHEFLGICDMFKYRDTENEAVRLMMFPLSLTGEAKTWLDELNEGTIETWDELRTAFISRFFPPALFDRLLREIRAFSQHENESLTDAWLPKNHQASIQNLETKFDRLADNSGSLPSNTQPNPKGHNSKAYQPPQSRNEHVNAVFTRSGKSYNPPVNPNDQQNDSETHINFDSDDKDEESTPQPKTQNPKPVKETPLPKPYKPKIPYRQRLRKEKMEA